MARVISNTNDRLRKEYEERRKKLNLSKTLYALGFVAIIAGLLLAIIAPIGISVAALAIPAFVFGTKLFNENKTKADIVRSGSEGEKAALYSISRLPDDYTVLTNRKITYEGKTSELDFIVIGKTGVFIIENKNARGHISGNLEDRDWRQRKSSPGGITTDKFFYNPIKQVGTHVYRLANFIRKNGINVYVRGIVFFSNPEAYLDIETDDGHPVFAASSGEGSIMRKYITDHPGNLSPQDIKRITELLAEQTDPE